MNDELDLNAEDKPKNKPGPKPKAANKAPGKKDIGEKIQANRISYKDRRKLDVSGRDDDNFVYRIVNHDSNKFAGNVEKRMEMGYKFANEGESFSDLQGVKASQIGSNIGTHVGSGTQGILMKIPKEYYAQDQTEKQAEVDRTEEGMVDDELKNDSSMRGEGLKITDKRGTRVEMNVRNN